MSERHFIIGYDIASPQRLLRVYREMCKHAAPLEYSVFILVGSVEDKDRCLDELTQLIDLKKDDIRCYPLPIRGFQERIGRAGLPAGIHWTGMPAAMA